MEADRTTTFKCYEGGWEKEARAKKLANHEFRLLQKYKGVRFFDEDVDQVYEIFANNLEWQKKIGKDPTTPCYVVLAKPSTTTATTKAWPKTPQTTARSSSRTALTMRCLP